MSMRIFLIMALIVGLLSCSAESKQKRELKTQLDSIAYAIGASTGMNLERDSIMLDPDIVSAGIHDALYGDTTLLSDAQMQQVLMALQMQLREKQMERQKKQMEERNAKGSENKATGEKFLAENKTKEGVKTTSSGLQYRIIKPGTGKKPNDSSMVTVHYTGRLINGKVFDSSVQRGEPAKFAVNRVIKGWTEALTMMKEGAKWELYIPSELGYGDRGAGADIGPNEVLIFEVELIKIGS